MTENDWWQTEENDEVATKPELWRPLSRAMGGFDLDPAAGAEPTPIADERYTKEDDGLSKPWHGTVWLNPPYSKNSDSEKEDWFYRLVSKYQDGKIDAAVAVCNTDTSADWYQDWFSTADVIGQLDGRDWFLENGDSPNFASMVGVWNPTDDVIEVLHGLGTVVEPQQQGEQLTL